MKPKNPFKDLQKIKKEIAVFLKKHRTTISTQGSRINQYFEMSAYNSIVKFYENNGYDVDVKNLKNGQFKYKLSPTGYPNNFSYFEVSKIYNYKNIRKEFYFEIHHNIAAESSINSNLYVTPDISVINKDSIKELNNPRYFFSGSRAYHFVPNNDLQTFCEVKNYNPFPELLFNYIGLLQELKHDVFTRKHSCKNPKHIAPSMMISGGGNYHTQLIKKDIMKRYNTNVFFGLFFSKNQPYSTINMSNVKKIGTIL